MGELPRLLDPEALDEREDPRGRLSIVVPAEWLREGARLEVDLPAKLKCDLCDGGGCDACNRSGAYKLDDESRKPLAITLPRVTDDLFALRVTNPIVDHQPTLLVVRVAAGTEPSAGVRFVGPNHDFPPRVGDMQPQMPPMPAWVGWVAIIVIASVLAIIASRLMR